MIHQNLSISLLSGSSSNPCDPNPCLNSGTCTVIGSTYDCACTASWTGSICDVLVQSCQPNPCQNGGTCSIIGNSVSCDCPPNWGGPNCESKPPNILFHVGLSSFNANSFVRVCLSVIYL